MILRVRERELGRKRHHTPDHHRIRPCDAQIGERGVLAERRGVEREWLGLEHRVVSGDVVVRSRGGAGPLALLENDFELCPKFVVRALERLLLLLESLDNATRQRSGQAERTNEQTVRSLRHIELRLERVEARRELVEPYGDDDAGIRRDPSDEIGAHVRERSSLEDRPFHRRRFGRREGGPQLRHTGQKRVVGGPIVEETRRCELLLTGGGTESIDRLRECRGA